MFEASWTLRDLGVGSPLVREFDILSMDPLKMVNADTLEKVVLTRRVSDFLHRSDDQEQRAVIENVARALAQDVATKVREALAFELRTCPYLPHDLAAKIASDVESVAGPFLASTTVFSDSQLAGLVPHLEEHAHVTIARRKNLGESTCEAIVTFGSEKSVSFLVRNDTAPLNESVLSRIVKRFPERQTLMDQLGARPELPLSIVTAIVDKVSDTYRSLLEGQYGVSADVSDNVMRTAASKTTWVMIEQASARQVHAYVGDLRAQKRLTIDLMLDMAEKGSIAFLESALAFRSGLTLSAAKDMLHSGDGTLFVALMKQADISKADAHTILQVLKANA